MKILVYTTLTLAGVLLTGACWTWVLDLKPILESTGITINQWFLLYALWGILSGLTAGLLSRDISIWSTDTNVIEPADDHFLYRKVERLAKEQGLTWMPQVGVFPSDEINLFSAGPFPRRSIISVSQGFLSLKGDLQDSFLSAELMKIKNLDTSTLVFCHGITHGFVLYIARMLAFLLGTSFRQTEGNSSSTYPEIIVSALATTFLTFFGSVVVYGLARKRNLEGDEFIGLRYGPERMTLARKSLPQNRGGEAYDLFTKLLKVNFPKRRIT